MSRRGVLAVLGALATGLLGACSVGPPRGVPREAPGETAIPYRYGDHPLQVADLRLPSATPATSATSATFATGSRRVVALIHGGFWQSGYDRSLEDAVAADLVAAGYAVWNVDYRAVGDDGGGWPGTFTDVASALDLLADAARDHSLDLSTLAVVGHSAGGHLALWSAVRGGLPDGAPGAGPVVAPVRVCAQAGVVDLATASADGLGGGAADSLLGGSPADVPDRYAIASPAARLPIGVPLLLVTGGDDDVVPPSQSVGFAAAAREAGDAVQIEVVPGEGHFEHLDPRSGVWAAVREWLTATG